MNLLIILFCILYFILAFRRLDWAVMLLVAALPSYLIRSSFLGIPFTLLEVMILISFGVWILKNYREIINNLKNIISGEKRKGRRYPFDIEIVLLLIISFLAVFVAGLTDSAFGIWKAYFFEPALLFIVVLNVFGNRKKLSSGYPELSFDKLMWPLLISAFAVSVFAIFQKFTGLFIFNEFWAAEETRRVTSFFGFPNAVGLYLGPIVLIVFGWFASVIARSVSDEAIPGQSAQQRLLRFARNDKIVLFFSILVITLSGLAIYFAKSEGALIAVIAGLAVFGLLANPPSLKLRPASKKISPPSPRLRRIKLAIIVFIVIATSGILIFERTRDYATNKFLLRDLSGQIRKAQWKETWEMLKDDRIIFGSGLANYKEAVFPYHKEGIFVRDYKDPDWHRKTVFNEEFRNKVWQPLEIYLYPHNIFLNAWVELGILGMILFIWIIGKFFTIAIKNIKSDKKYFILGLVGAMVVIVIHGLVDVPYFKNDLAVIFWIIIAMMSLVNLKLKNES